LPIEASFYVSLQVSGSIKVLTLLQPTNIIVDIIFVWGMVYINTEHCLFAEDEQFEADKAQVVKEIAELEAKGPLFSGELHKFPGTPTASGELYKLPTTPLSRQLT